MSSNWGPNGDPNVGTSVRGVVWMYTFVPSWLTAKFVMSNDPGMKLTVEVGYWYVPGPLSSPDGSDTSSTVVPGSFTLITASWLYAVLRWSVAVTVIVVLPKPVGNVSVQSPVFGSAVAAAIAAAPPLAPTPSATTCARGVVVPVTVTVEGSMLSSFVGEVTVSGSVPGIPWATYRSVTMSGVSRLRPALRSSARRAYDACAHVSGLAEPAGWPFTKPIDAVEGSVPNGEGATIASSHTCSGSSPCAELIFRIAVRSVVPPLESPLTMSYSPRSAGSAGDGWPGPVSVGGHGAPIVVQLEPLGWKQSP